MNIRTVQCIPLSEILTPNQREELESNNVTWGDANLTLIDKATFIQEFGNLETIEGGTIESDIPDGVYIDMEG